VTERFREAFEARRAKGMRGDVDAGGWNGLYRLALNTVAMAGAAITCGDSMTFAERPA
jgi:hypothetical protein